MGRKGRNRKTGGEIYEMGTGIRKKNTKIHGKRKIKREKLSERARKRAWGFEERLREGKGSELTRLCWWEMREEALEGKTGSEDGRKRERGSLKTGDERLKRWRGEERKEMGGLES